MELGALICMPRNAQCAICPVKKLCVAFRENRVEDLPNLDEREQATAQRFFAFVIERDGEFLVRQRPVGVVNAHLWEFPNVEVNGSKISVKNILNTEFGVTATKVSPLVKIKHSITRYRITVEAFTVHPGGASFVSPHSNSNHAHWKTPAQMQALAFTSAHGKILRAANVNTLSPAPNERKLTKP
jgi:A/G-specific adenine glycosylase